VDIVIDRVIVRHRPVSPWKNRLLVRTAPKRNISLGIGGGFCRRRGGGLDDTRCPARLWFRLSVAPDRSFSGHAAIFRHFSL
jgi:hypothetical protein